jgi:hypothetical protein
MQMGVFQQPYKKRPPPLGWTGAFFRLIECYCLLCSSWQHHERAGYHFLRVIPEVRDYRHNAGTYHRLLTNLDLKGDGVLINHDFVTLIDILPELHLGLVFGKVGSLTNDGNIHLISPCPASGRNNDHCGPEGYLECPFITFRRCGYEDSPGADNCIGIDHNLYFKSVIGLIIDLVHGDTLSEVNRDFILRNILKCVLSGERNLQCLSLSAFGWHEGQGKATEAAVSHNHR